MKSIIKLLLAVILIGTISTGCTKYVDGPKFSLLTKKTRLCHNWQIELVTFNGTDVTAATTALLGTDYQFQITKDGKYTVTGTNPDDGTWKFGEDKDDAYFNSSKGTPELAWHLLRLESKSLWAQVTATNGDVTITHYKR